MILKLTASTLLMISCFNAISLLYASPSRGWKPQITSAPLPKLTPHVYDLAVEVDLLTLALKRPSSR